MTRRSCSTTTQQRFHYEPPTEPLDLRSGIICSPNNFRYADGQQLDEGFIRITSLADPDYWMRLPEEEYVPRKSNGASG